MFHVKHLRKRSRKANWSRTDFQRFQHQAKKLLSKKPTKKKAMGGDLKTEYRGGGMVNLGNFKGQF